jgi:hypothetical protein
MKKAITLVALFSLTGVSWAATNREATNDRLDHAGSILREISPQHWFRISGRPFMVHGGYPRFQYEGYWITLLHPWPEYWSNDWYDNDDVYVDYGNDGYYMYNRRFPEAAIAISISL